MKDPLDLLNAAALAAALALGAWGGHWSTGRGIPDPQRRPQLAASIEPETGPDGGRFLRDAGGHLVPLERYERIASGSLIADRVLSELAAPQRIVAFSRQGQQSSPWRHRYQDKPALAARAPVEQVLALHPDLLLVNNIVDPGRTARLREQGVRVFDLGHMRGLSTLLANIRAIGWLLGVPERAERYAVSLQRRMQAVARHTPPERRPRAVYAAVFGDRVYGGAAGTSYHDVLTHAGFVDAAAEAGLQGWPPLSTEQLLQLDPQVLLTKPGMGRVICRREGLEHMQACSEGGRVIEIQGDLLDDPGPGMLEATEAVHAAYWR